MPRLKTLNRLLWGLNVLLASAALIVATRPTGIDRRSDLDLSAAAPSPRTPPTPPPRDAAMAELPNPIGPRAATPSATLPLTLQGALPAEHGGGGIAFIKVGGCETIAARGEEVHGWRLCDLWKDRATFLSPAGRRTEVVIEPFAPPSTHR